MPGPDPHNKARNRIKNNDWKEGNGKCHFCEWFNYYVRNTGVHSDTSWDYELTLARLLDRGTKYRNQLFLFLPAIT